MVSKRMLAVVIFSIAVPFQTFAAASSTTPVEEAPNSPKERWFRRLYRIDPAEGVYRFFPLMRIDGEGVGVLWPLFYWGPGHKRLVPALWDVRQTAVPPATADAPPPATAAARTTTQTVLAVLPVFFRRDVPETGARRSFFLTAYVQREGDRRSWGVLPLVGFTRKGQSDYFFNLLYLLIVKRDGEARSHGLLPLWWSSRERASGGERSRLIGPVYWQTRDGRLDYFIVFPVFWKTPSFWTVFPLVWKFDDGAGLFPVYGAGVRTDTPPEENDPSSSGTLCAPAPAAPSAQTRWRYVLWPLYNSVDGPAESSTNILWPFFNKGRKGDRQSGWRLLPLAIHGREQTYLCRENTLERGQYVWTLIVPLLTSWRRYEGGVCRLSDVGGPAEATSASVSSAECGAVLLYRDGRERVTAPTGNVIQDRHWRAFFPVFQTQSDNLLRQRSCVYLLGCASAYRREDGAGWRVLGGALARYDKERPRVRFGLLWRLFEYSKDDDGVKRLRLLYSPAFRIGSESNE